MGKILEMERADLEHIDKAYAWMENERAKKGEIITRSKYSTITDYYVPFDMHISLFYDTKNEKMYVRTFIYASGLVTYEELVNPERLINESDESKTIAWMLLRTGVFLCNR